MEGSHFGELREALESSGVRKFLLTHGVEVMDKDAFKKHHRSWCKAIMSSLTSAGIKKVTFGRAAKLIAIYLKSVVVLGAKHRSAFGKVAHPPIDGILLSNLARSEDVASPHKKDWIKVRWTRLKEDEYYCLVDQLLDVLSAHDPFWMLERYWTVTK